jgi:hypothetical protein
MCFENVHLNVKSGLLSYGMCGIEEEEEEE